MGRDTVLQRIEALIEGLVEDGVSMRLDHLVDEFKRDPERFLPPYMPPAELLEPHPRRGRKPGSTNVTAEYFWEQYKCAVDGSSALGWTRMQRPFRGTHLATRMGLAYRTFKRYLDRWGAPEGYAKPHE